MPRFLTYVHLPAAADDQLEQRRVQLGSPPLRFRHTTVYMIPARREYESALVAEVERVAAQSFSPAIELNSWKIFSDTDTGRRLLALEGRSGDLRSIHMDIASGQREYIDWQAVVRPTDLDCFEDRVFSRWGSPYFGSQFKPHTSVAFVGPEYLPRKDDMSIVWKPRSLTVARKDPQGWTEIATFPFAKPF